MADYNSRHAPRGGELPAFLPAAAADYNSHGAPRPLPATGLPRARGSLFPPREASPEAAGTLPPPLEGRGVTAEPPASTREGKLPRPPPPPLLHPPPVEKAGPAKRLLRDFFHNHTSSQLHRCSLFVSQ